MPIKSVARGIVGLGLIVLTASQLAPAHAAGASKKEIQRGRYLVNYGGCNDCHTPKVMTANGPVPDKSRLLSGHPWGISFAANLTPDQQTGLGGWTAELFIKTMRTGKHFGVARPLLPPMPWFSLAALSDRDLKAVFAYLKSIKPIRNQVPQPVPPQ
jgi:mono/diheme cytochrome c family protein